MSASQQCQAWNAENSNADDIQITSSYWST